MQLAKPALDVGLYTNQIDQSLTFWQEEAGVPFSELLPVGGGLHQHRHAIGQSVLKINHPREPVARGNATGLSALTIYRENIDTIQALTDPDGNPVTLHPATDEGNLALTLSVNDLDQSADFYANALGLTETKPHTFSVGESRIVLQQGNVEPFERAGIGYRYMTFQVFDVVASHATFLNHGAREGMAPVRLGDVAYISFILDPDGNWLEISQRKSITGSLD